MGLLFILLNQQTTLLGSSHHNPKWWTLMMSFTRQAKKINHISGKILPADDIESQKATMMWKIQPPHEESAQLYDPTFPGPHPTVEITDKDWKKGERIQKYLTNLRCKWEDRFGGIPQQYYMMAVPVERMGQLGVLPFESFDQTNMISMMPLMTAVAENMGPFHIVTPQQTHKWVLLTGHLALYKLWHVVKKCVGFWDFFEHIVHLQNLFVSTVFL